MKLNSVHEKYEQDKASKRVWQAQGTDTRWKFRREDGKIVAKTTEKKLKEAYVKYYLEQQKEEKRDARTISFDDMFKEWIEAQEARRTIAAGTIYKYQTDYNRCIKGKPFAQLSIADISEDEITDFLTELALELHLKKQAVKNVSGYIKNTLAKARKAKLITENPFDFVEMQTILDYCSDMVDYDSDEREEVEAKERVLTAEEMGELLKQLHKEQASKPDYLPCYCIEACIYTGMRVGEVVALKWKDIQNGELHIRRSEHRISAMGKPATFKIGPTKNKKNRRVPISPELQTLFDKLKKLQTTLGIDSEFIFEGVEGRTKAPHVSNCCFRETRRAGFEEMSIHAIRRTVSSNLHKLGVADATICEILGHSQSVNKNHYSYDVSSLQEKISLMASSYKKPEKKGKTNVA